MGLANGIDEVIANWCSVSESREVTEVGTDSEHIDVDLKLTFTNVIANAFHTRCIDIFQTFVIFQFFHIFVHKKILKLLILMLNAPRNSPKGILRGFRPDIDN